MLFPCTLIRLFLVRWIEIGSPLSFQFPARSTRETNRGKTMITKSDFFSFHRFQVGIINHRLDPTFLMKRWFYVPGNVIAYINLPLNDPRFPRDLLFHVKP